MEDDSKVLGLHSGGILGYVERLHIGKRRIVA